MEADPWRLILRDLLPRYRSDTLTAFVAEVASGGKRLCHRSTTEPPPIHGLRDYPCGAACAVAWQGATGAATTGEVEEWFGEAVAFIQPHRWVLLKNAWDGELWTGGDPEIERLDRQREADWLAEVEAELKRRLPELEAS